MQGLSGKLKVFIRLDSVLQRSVATTYACFLIMETFLNATIVISYIWPSMRKQSLCASPCYHWAPASSCQHYWDCSCACSYAVCQFNQASLYYLVLLASLTRPWQILFLGCCLSIKDYRGYAQGVTSSDYFIFLGYSPWIIVLWVAKSWSVVWYTVSDPWRCSWPSLAKYVCSVVQQTD